MEPGQIKELRESLGLNMAAFGRGFGVGGNAVKYWEKKGGSIPPKDKMRRLQEYRNRIALDPSQKEEILRELSNIDRVSEGKGDYMGQADPYSPLPEPDSVMGIAWQEYQKLDPEAKARADVAFCNAVMKEKVRNDYNKEE
jgi:transcriptional regulator with XRE-family HTH domain